MRTGLPSAPHYARSSATSSMSSSVLYTATVPAFDRTTGQLSLASHHLISAPRSFLDLIPANYALFFDEPPTRPYQQPLADLDAERPRRKRRRTAPPSAESASPADFALQRDKRDRQMTTDKESAQHHASVALDLRAAIEAVQQGWAARAEDEGWGLGGLGARRVEWRAQKGADERNELDLVVLAASEREREAVEEPLRLDSPRSRLELPQLFERLVLNDSPAASIVVEVNGPTVDEGPVLAPQAELLVPPSSGFLMSDLSTWSAPSSGIAKLGREKGGWDVVVIECVLFTLALCARARDQLLNLVPLRSPPWPNASASRSASYETFDAYDLWKLDLPALLGDRPAVVAVWLTNRVKVRLLSLFARALSSAHKLTEPPCSFVDSCRTRSFRHGASRARPSGGGSRWRPRPASPFGPSTRRTGGATKVRTASSHSCSTSC